MAPPVTPPVPLFPASSLKFVIDPDLNGALAQAHQEMVGMVKDANQITSDRFEEARKKKPRTPPPKVWTLDPPFSLAIIDLGNGGSGEKLKCGGFNADSLQYIASGAKIAAMFGAFAVRDLVHRVWAAARTAQMMQVGVDVLAGVLGAKPAIGPAASLEQILNARVDPAILAAAPPTIQAAVSSRAPMVPAYNAVFTMPAAGSSAKPDFRGDFTAAMRQMIVPSDNDAAGTCIRGVGYAYINAALAALGLPSKKGEPGVWLAGDYGTYLYVYVNTTNDGFDAQAGSAMAMAQLMAMILNKAILTSGDCDAMLALLADAAKGPDVPWLTRDTIGEDWRIPKAKVTHAKLGRGPLKDGGYVGSETFRLANPRTPGKNYCVAFQNVDNIRSNMNEVAYMLHRALEIYDP